MNLFSSILLIRPWILYYQACRFCHLLTLLEVEVECFMQLFGVPRTRRRRVDAGCDHHLLHRTSPRSCICFGILLCPDPAGFPPVIGAGAALRRSHAPSPDHSPSGSDGEHLRGGSACTRALILRQYYLILGWRCRVVPFMSPLDKSPGALFSSFSLSLRASLPRHPDSPHFLWPLFLFPAS